MLRTVQQAPRAGMAVALFLLAGCGEKGPCSDAWRDDERHAVWEELLPTLPLAEGDELCTAREDVLVAYHTSAGREEIDQRYVEWLSGLGYQETEVHRSGGGEVDGHTFASETRQLQWTFRPYISVAGIELKTEPRSGPVVSLASVREARDSAWERVRTTWPTLREALSGLEGEQA